MNNRDEYVIADPGDIQVQGIPEGARVRYRYRPDDFARVFVRTDTDCTEYVIRRRPNGEHYLAGPVARNRRG